MLYKNTVRLVTVTLGSVGLLAGCRIGGALQKDVEGQKGALVKRGPGEIVIFYANETSSESAVISGQYQKIISAIQKSKAGLSDAEQSALDRVGNSYAADLSRFSSQVKKDIAGLEKQICTGYGPERKAALFVFTNALAKKRQAQMCVPGENTGVLQNISFDTQLTATQGEDFRYAESPLALESNLFEALSLVKQTAASYQLTDFASVLIVKSHGGGDLSVAPKLSFRSDLMSENDLIERYRGIAASIAWSTVKLVDLRLADGRRLGDVVSGSTKLDSVLIQSTEPGGKQMKLSDLKLGDLNLGADGALKVGDLKVGDLKVGDLKVGDLKVGDLKVGDLKVGDLKSNDLKVGDLKLGELKIGELKVGDLKVGELKSGDLKNDLAADASVLKSPGIKKANLVTIVSQSAMNYQLIFLESCDSDLGANLMVELLFGVWNWDGNGSVGSLYYSDNKGLQFETVDYGGLARVSNYFSDTLELALEAKKVR